MDIQAHEIASIQRIQCEELWKAYSQSRVDVAVENWGVCNQHRLFSETDTNSPATLLNDPGSFLDKIFNSTGIKIFNRPSFCHSHCYKEENNGNKQIILLRVTLGRIDEGFPSDPPSMSKICHLKRTRSNRGEFSIRNTTQAYPEYVITYKKTSVPAINHCQNRSNPTPRKMTTKQRS